jgi:hypothetical protein
MKLVGKVKENSKMGIFESAKRRAQSAKGKKDLHHPFTSFIRGTEDTEDLELCFF